MSHPPPPGDEWGLLDWGGDDDSRQARLERRAGGGDRTFLLRGPAAAARAPLDVLRTNEEDLLCLEAYARSIGLDICGIGHVPGEQL